MGLSTLVLTVANQSRYILHNVSDYFLIKSVNCHFCLDLEQLEWFFLSICYMDSFYLIKCFKFSLIIDL